MSHAGDRANKQALVCFTACPPILEQGAEWLWLGRFLCRVESCHPSALKFDTYKQHRQERMKYHKWAFEMPH